MPELGNNEVRADERAAWERGYKEALLDVYCFLTGNPQALDIGAGRFSLLQAMTNQITQASSGRLKEVEDE